MWLRKLAHTKSLFPSVHLASTIWAVRTNLAGMKLAGKSRTSDSRSRSARSESMASSPPAPSTAVGSVAAARRSITIRPARLKSSLSDGSRSTTRAAAFTMDS